MKVSVVYQYYQGHGEPGHSLIYELTQYLANRGHEVTVIAGETGYMKCAASASPWYRRLIRRETVGGVKVVRTYCYSELHRSYWGRLLGFISFAVTCPLGLLCSGKPDVLLASSPPIFPIFTAMMVAKLRGIPFVVEVRDLWPASAVQMGIIRSRPLIGIMSWMEKVLYNQAIKVIALTGGIREDICGRGWPEEKIALITCGVDLDQLHPDTEGAAAVRVRHGWGRKKVVMYFGALGEANNIPVILRAAERLRERTDILFVLIGDGMKRRAAEQQSAEMNLRNLIFLPPVPKEQARMYLSAADLCLVTLKDIPLFAGAIPTKLIDYMACAKPVLCGVRGEAKQIVDEAGAGLTFAPDDDRRLSELVIELLSDPGEAFRMGQAGNAYVRQYFSAAAKRRETEEILLEAAGTVVANAFVAGQTK